MRVQLPQLSLPIQREGDRGDDKVQVEEVTKSAFTERHCITDIDGDGKSWMEEIKYLYMYQCSQATVQGVHQMVVLMIFNPSSTWTNQAISLYIMNQQSSTSTFYQSH